MIIEIGKKYNRLTVINFSHKDDKSRNWYVFECVCGNLRTLHTGNVTSGNTKSCGCLAKDRYKKQQEKAQTTKKGVKTAIYLQYKRHAKDRGIEFNLSKDDLISISQNNCAYCDIPPSIFKKS